jgi:hypothetical protein
MPLPLIIAAGIGIGAFIAGRSAKKNSTANTNFIATSIKKEMGVNEKNYAAFVASLIGVAANSDGNISDEEEKEIKKIVSQINDSYEVEAAFGEKLIKLISEPVNFKILRDTYATIKDPTEEQIEEFRSFIHQVVTADQIISDAEKAFQFKCELMFENINDIPLIKVVNNRDEECVKSEYIKYFTEIEIKNKYPMTQLNYSDLDSFLTIHPSNNLELVSFNLFFEDNFATSKDTELIDAARLSGAKKVSVYAYSKDIDEKSITMSGEISGGVSFNKIDVNANRAASKMLDMEEKSSLVFEFEGKRPGIFKNFNGHNEKQILSKSKWLQYDPNLVEFVKSCFGQNRVMSFDHEIEYTEIGNAMESARIAAKCGLKGISVKANNDFKSKINKLQKRKVRYTVSFI